VAEVDGGAAPELLTAVVLEAGEESCTVFRDGAAVVLPYARPFPRPRAGRMSPGHLVALVAAAHRPTVVWRWFDAVVLGTSSHGVHLWEPLHGEITAQPRNAGTGLSPGSRAYVSAGLPGADWWLAAPASGAPEEARVDLAEVWRFSVDHGLQGALDAD
jgi:hypothetical protein